MFEVFQSVATTIMVHMRSVYTDRGLAGESASLTIFASKAGAAFADITSGCTITDRSNGWYSVLVPSSATDTLGILQFRITSTNCHPNDDVAVKVVDKAGSLFTIGTVVSDGSNAANSFKTNLAQTDDDFWKDCFLTLIDGDCAEQTKRVTAFDATTDFIEVASPGFTAIPAAGVKFYLVNK